MASIVEELSISMGFNVKDALIGLKKTQDGLDGITKQAHSTNKTLESSAKAVTSAYSAIRNEILLIGGALLGVSSIKSFFTGSVDEMSKLKFLSETLGMSTERLQEFQIAAEKMGSSGSSIVGFLDSIGDTVKDLSLGQGKFTEGGVYSLLNLLGSDYDYSKIKDREGALLAYADATKAAYAQGSEIGGGFAKSLGIPSDLLPFMKQGSGGVAAMLEAQKKLATVTKKDADEAQGLKSALVEINKEFEGVGNKIVIALIPAIKQVMGYFHELGAWTLAHKEDIAKIFGNAANGAAKFVKALFGENNDVAKKLDVWLERLGKMAHLVGLVADGAGAIADFIDPNFSKNSQKVYTPDNPDKKLRKQANGSFINDVMDTVGLGSKTTPSLIKQGREIIDFFQSKGWTREQAAGIAANLWEESNFRSNAVGDGGNAYGVGQWQKPRQAKFKEVFGQDIRKSTLQEQLAFVDWELHNTESKAGYLLKGATTAKNSGAIVSSQYERPAAKIKEMMERGSLARKLFAETYDNTKSIGANNASASSGNSYHVETINVTSPDPMKAKEALTKGVQNASYQQNLRGQSKN